jgi:hypothetical protein
MPGNIKAMSMDIVLSRLAEESLAEGKVSTEAQTLFSHLVSDFGFAIGPKSISPAETLGYNGFLFGLKGSLTTIDNRAEHWKKATRGGDPDPVIFTPVIYLRKGLPFSFELGTGIGYITNTSLAFVELDVKWSILEGFHEGLGGHLPDVAIRGSVSHLLGEDELTLTASGIDFSISKPFGIGGMSNLTPYVGYQYLWIIGDSEVVVPNSAIRAYKDESYFSAYVIFDREVIKRHRVFVGLRIISGYISIIPEVSITNGQITTALSFGADF